MNRTFTIVIALLLLLPAVSIAQWQWLNPKPSAYGGLNVIFTDAVTGFILQADGSLVKTVDQGVHWEVNQRFSGVLTMDIHDSTGVLAGYGGTVYISSDIGNTWERKNTGNGDVYAMADIVSRDTLFLANENGNIYRSDDRGATWQSFYCGIRISSIEFINSKVGFAGGVNSMILKTEDGGATWQPVVTVNTTPSNTTVIRFSDVNNGVAFRQHSDLLRTTDGGKTWNISSIGDYMNDIYFVDHNTGFAVGELGAAYRTDDGGQSWNWIGMNARIYGYDLNSVYFVNANIGFAVGLRGRILKTIDGGANWTTYSPTYLDVNALAAPTPMTAYAAVGNSLFKTTDGGNEWQQLAFQVGTEYAEYDVFQTCHFFSADTGLVTASSYARVYKTYDGGQTWKQIGPTPYLYETVTDLQFLDGHTGFLAANIGYGGIIVKTKDAGETWTPVWESQYYGEVFDKICFVDEKTGYASRGSLYKTTDSGRTWTSLWQDQSISSINFVNAATGFVAGENGMLKRTIDSGKTWQDIKISAQYGEDIYKVKFLSKQVGYVTAEGGTIYKTIDGGNSWQVSGNASYNTLHTIHVAQDTTVYVAGTNGVIMKMADASEASVPSPSLRAYNHDCVTDFSAYVTAVLKPADSIQFEYGIGTYDHVVKATPYSVSDGQQEIKATVDSLLFGALYDVRVKFLFKGRYQYSEPYSFYALARPPKPVITANGVKLSSSVAYGNQWYVNDTAITGARDVSYIARTPGKYTVRSTVNNCIGEMSAPFNVVITAINSPVLESQLQIGPNPVHGPLYIRHTGNPATLVFALTDMQGRAIYRTNFSGSLTVDMSRYVPGMYIVQISNTRSQERVYKTIVNN